MVAQITEGTAFDKHGRPFRRRNPRPAIVVVILLAIATAVAWTVALTRPTDVREAATCNPRHSRPGRRHRPGSVSRCREPK
ncbi:putative conserved secreted protein [Mycobacterium kansasii]|uniref:Putative conserved secreted protein n=1 Tax=Mycobacterium kansasii TaxID=1768 RepID=A0A1V3XS30_MYCKA|nr:putative conserved secreted protein [Mycobacterium kansasii]